MNDDTGDFADEPDDSGGEEDSKSLPLIPPGCSTSKGGVQVNPSLDVDSSPELHTSLLTRKSAGDCQELSEEES